MIFDYKSLLSKKIYIILKFSLAFEIWGVAELQAI